MKAGRKLDALVAEKVMGLKVEKIELPKSELIRAIYRIKDEYFVKDYSTNIADAWEVVEKLKLCVWPTDNGRWFVHQSEFTEEYGDEYWFGGGKIDLTVERTPGSAVAETAPHAICLAALKAVGVDGT